MRNNPKNLIDYIQVFLLICISGNPFFNSNSILIFCLILFLLIFLIRFKSVSKIFLLFISLLLVIFIFQSANFQEFYLVSWLGLIVRISSAYFVLKNTAENFINLYIKSMLFIACYSLLLYFVSNINYEILNSLSINTSGEESLYSRISFLGIFTFIIRDLGRNCGMFWEAGAYGGYLILSFIFTYISSFPNRRKYLAIFFLSIITTFSTTAYISLFIFLILSNTLKIKYLLTRGIFLIPFLIASIFIFDSSSFLYKKISNQYEYAINWSYSREGRIDSRFVNLLVDIEEFKGYEFFGRGINQKTRYSGEFDDRISTVGVSDYLLKFGLPFFLFSIFLVYKSFYALLIYYNRFSRLMLFNFCFILFTILLSEVYYNFPFFWGLFFLTEVYKREYV